VMVVNLHHGRITVGQVRCRTEQLLFTSSSTSSSGTGSSSLDFSIDFRFNQLLSYSVSDSVT